ncbi:S46 family peptidase [Enhygromyxa salina]|uniref:Dipeptidyl-peptidase n=1 Tax=Enhygromyxa salina TaxID=215803 RepID=A0A2S9YUR2_9BACT|nr:S46 family peptidase [Enhygromyxa salina]PRQ08823.1 Peptidase S46 [Enhygromyxa salina]
MSRFVSIPLSLACLCAPLLLCTQAALANEGQWKPSQIAEIQPEAAKAGLTLDASALWDPAGDEHTGGLMRAAVNFSGCSAAFVSADGLIATNHHCAYGALQGNSTVEHDYLKDGFVAKTRGEELPATGNSIKILRSITDVSEQVHAKLEGIEDDGARARAYDQARNELVDACEAAAEFRNCHVSSFFGGKLFELHEYVELRDVRLVYAPPSAIGEYGGETDNWMWPRHTGDFSLLRAYASPEGEPSDYATQNVPYHPTQWLRPSAQGVDPGDFVAVLGYPGKTDRYLWASELERHHQQWLPMRVSMYGEWIEILEAAGQRDAAVGIKVAALKKSLANRHKNAAGKIAGLDRSKFSATRGAEDRRMLEGGDDQAIATLEALASITEARREREAWSFLLDSLNYAPRSLVIARDLVTWSQERAKPDVERKSGYRDRDHDRVWNRLEQATKDYDAQVDVELLASFLAYADMLEGRRIAGFDKIMGAAKGQGGMPSKRDGVSGPPEAYLAAAKDALKGSALADPKALQQMFENPGKTAASKDPMLVLARSLVPELDELAKIKDAERGRLLELEPHYFELISRMRGTSLYSDANGTLRMSHATVQGYSKWNDQVQEPQTVLAGAVAKHRDAGEFDLPDAVLEQAKTATASRWIDAELGDVPIAFLADCDTTGGNSGSPVINGKGELVGFNFDRVWENVAGDYLWRASHSRNVIADARYLYWMLDEVEGAGHLLTELGVAEFEGAAPKGAPSGEAEGAKQGERTGTKPATARKPASAAGCGCTVEQEPWAPGVLLFGLVGLAGLRRRKRD